MEIEFFARPSDIASFRFYHLQTSPAAKKQQNIWYVLGGSFVVYMTVPFLRFNLWFGLGMLVSSLALFILFCKFYEWLFGPYMMKLATHLLIWMGKPKATFGHHRIRLNEREIVETSNQHEKRTQWYDVQRISENDEYVFIYDTPKSAYVIPKSAFFSQSRAQEFFETAKNFHSMAAA
jgi:hypothetical protein